MTHRYWTLGLLAVLGGGLTAAPAAATDQDTFNKLLAKVAPLESGLGQNFKPKAACACPNDGVNPARAGVLVSEPIVGGKPDIRCAIPSFDADGKVFALTFCDGFAVLGH
jgi:hypothetical protein